MNAPFIFEDFDHIDLGSVVLALPSQDIDTEAEILYQITRDQEIRKWMPRFSGINTVEKAREVLINHLLVVAGSLGMFLTLKFKSTGRTFAYIYLEKVNEDTWKIEYCIESESRRKGVMFAAVDTMLTYLQKNKVKYVDAVQQPENKVNEKLLKKLRFTLMPQQPVTDKQLYKIRLN